MLALSNFKNFYLFILYYSIPLSYLNDFANYNVFYNRPKVATKQPNLIKF